MVKDIRKSVETMDQHNAKILLRLCLATKEAHQLILCQKRPNKVSKEISPILTLCLATKEAHQAASATNSDACEGFRIECLGFRVYGLGFRVAIESTVENLCLQLPGRCWIAFARFVRLWVHS